MDSVQIGEYSARLKQVALSELVGRILELEKLGFEYIPQMYPFLLEDQRQPGVKFSSGEVMEREDLERILAPLRFGDPKQVIALKALEYLSLVNEFLVQHGNDIPRIDYYENILKIKSHSL